MMDIEIIAQKIYIVRGQKVMLDEDLAELYGVLTKYLNRQVRRNADRFPSDFMFLLTNQEVTNLKCQFGTSNDEPFGRGGRRKPALAFTEQGVAMLSSVLRSDHAIKVNIAIMRAFVQLRAVLNSHQELKKQIEDLEKKHDGKFSIVFAAIKELMSDHKVPRKRIIGLDPKS